MDRRTKEDTIAFPTPQNHYILTQFPNHIFFLVELLLQQALAIKCLQSGSEKKRKKKGKEEMKDKDNKDVKY